MNPDKLAEFVTVLTFAAVVGLAVWLTVSYLEGTARTVVLALLVVVAIAVWQYLRTRFKRG